MTCTDGTLSGYPTYSPNPCSGSSLAGSYSPNAAAGTCPVGASTIASSATCVEACAAGYTAASYPTQTCFAQTWSGAQPACKARCAQPTPPSGGTSGSCSGVLDGNGGSCDFAPAYGYSLATSTNTMTCVDGTLSAVPTYSPNPCTGTSLVSSYSSHATVGTCPTGAGTLNSGQTCMESCDPGWTAATYPTQTCFAQVWTGLHPVCKKQCAQPIPPANSTSGDCSGVLDGNGGTCSFTPNPGFSLSTGSNTMTCNDGVLSSYPTYTSKRCSGSSLASLYSAHVSAGTCPVGATNLVSGASCVEVCTAGYTAIAYPAQTCTGGVWSGSQPVCKVQCTDLIPPTGATIGNCTGVLDGNGGWCVLGTAPGWTIGSDAIVTCNDGELSFPLFSLKLEASSADECATNSPCVNGAVCASVQSQSSDASATTYQLSCTCPVHPIQVFGPTCTFAVLGCVNCIATYTRSVPMALVGLGLSAAFSLSLTALSAEVTFVGPFPANVSHPLYGKEVASALTLLQSAGQQWNHLTQLDIIAFDSPTLQDNDITASASNSMKNPPSAYQPLSIVTNLPSSPTFNYSSLIFYSSSDCLAVGQFQPDGRGGCTPCPDGGFCVSATRCSTRFSVVRCC